MKNHLFHSPLGAVIHQCLFHRAGADQVALDGHKTVRQFNDLHRPDQGLQVIGGAVGAEVSNTKRILFLVSKGFADIIQVDAIGYVDHLRRRDVTLPDVVPIPRQDRHNPAGLPAQPSLQHTEQHGKRAVPAGAAQRDEGFRPDIAYLEDKRDPVTPRQQRPGGGGQRVDRGTDYQGRPLQVCGSLFAENLP